MADIVCEGCKKKIHFWQRLIVIDNRPYHIVCGIPEKHGVMIDCSRWQRKLRRIIKDHTKGAR